MDRPIEGACNFGLKRTTAGWDELKWTTLARRKINEASCLVSSVQPEGMLSCFT